MYNCAVQRSAVSHAAPQPVESEAQHVSELGLNSREGIVCAFSVRAVLWSKRLN